MPSSVVPYARFLEMQQRRRRVTTETAAQPVAPPHSADPRQRAEPLIIDCQAVGDERCGTRSTHADARLDAKRGSHDDNLNGGVLGGETLESPPGPNVLPESSE